ncbi:MAG TPA: CocE/NonD family hydrolase [Caulobacteraceae bacterium]|nr:CocE/NonD family hydrolase [Caulobacteraceae bacterium]
MAKWLKRGLIGAGVLVGGLAVLLVVTIVVAGLLYRDPGQARTPAGLARGASSYLTMRDGTRIAVTVWLPADLKSGQRVPALIKGTPYWRGEALTFLGKAAVQLGAPLRLEEPDVGILNARGYAVVSVDTRGTGASFGHQAVLLDQPEVDDFGQIIDWSAAQPWSNGRVGAYGFSYRGMLAVSMASLGRPALKAIAPSFDFTDLYATTYPGGVFNRIFLKKWGDQTGTLNRGEPPCEGVCRWLVAGPKPVDADHDGALLRAAIADHARNYDVFACSQRVPDRDDIVCGTGKTITDVSEWSRRAAVERSNVPMFVVAGWFDATSAAEVLQRTSTFSNPQQVMVGAISHGGFMSTDPFAPPGARVDPSYGKQIGAMADFFDRRLKADSQPAPTNVRYQVLNGGGWRSAPGWPPPGVVTQRFFADVGGTLSPQPPAGDGADAYQVDFSAGSGPLSRYQSPVDLSQTGYPDRAAADRKLLTYTSPPLADDLMIAGDPVADLTLASSRPDGVVIVYLEDMLPNGRVVYLSEGVLRLADRKLAAAPVGADPLHSYLSGDAAPMTPGRAEPIKLGLSPIAVIVRKGERLRIAIAGADSDNLERIPASGPETLQIGRGGAAPSFVEIPTLPH